MDDWDPTDPRLTAVMLRRELLALGWNDRALATQLATGAWVKARRGAYVDAATWGRLDRSGRHAVRARAALKQAKTEMVISHASALPFLDAPTWRQDLASIHLTRRDGKTGHDEAGVHQHRGVLLDGDWSMRHGVPVMSPTRVALEVTTVADAEPALVVMNHLTNAGLTSPAAIRARYELSMEQWPDTLKSDLVIRMCDPRIEAVSETRFVWLCFRQGLPAPVPQYEVRDERGAVIARLDFAWPELGRFVEVDGRVKYLPSSLRPGESPSDVVFREKRREDLVREITGWQGMRVVWDDYDRPDDTGRRLRRLLFPATRSAG